MKPFLQLIRSSLGKKYLMALSGSILVLFVLLHMLGNLQIFAGPETLNSYAHHLQSLPPPVKWGGRLFLLFCVLVHIWMAVLVNLENRRARPEKYRMEDTVEATYASRTMLMSGLILLSFIIFHIAHFTAKVIFDYSDLLYNLKGVIVPDVYTMMILGFSHWWVSLFYGLSMALLCLHLSHGVSSMFQSLGLRNESWRVILDKAGLIYGWVVFIGFVSIPIAVLSGIIRPLS